MERLVKAFTVSRSPYAPTHQRHRFLRASSIRHPSTDGNRSKDTANKWIALFFEALGDITVQFLR